MKILLVIAQDHPEIIWNAFRLGVLMAEAKEEVQIFLDGPSVKYEKLDSEKFPLKELAQRFVSAGGQLFG